KKAPAPPGRLPATSDPDAPVPIRDVLTAYAARFAANPEDSGTAPAPVAPPPTAAQLPSSDPTATAMFDPAAFGLAPKPERVGEGTERQGSGSQGAGIGDQGLESAARD